jgi:peptide/nickel transport system substrate-binding protein
MRHRTKAGIIAAAFSLVASLGAAEAQTLRIALQEDPDVLDPHRARTFVGRLVFTSLCDKLVDVNENLEFVPQLATEWGWSDDGLTLTFTLRDDVVFHDGTPLDASAVKASIDRARTLEDSLRKSELASVTNVEAVDERTVAITVAQPDATLLAQLSDRAGMILAPSAMEGGEFGQNPVCAGPYRFVERVQNDRIVLEKFPDYYDADEFHFEELVFLPIPDTTVRLANLRSGDVDILERLAPSDVESVRADANLNFQPITGIGYQGLTLNVANGERGTDGPFADKRVRQALQAAIDRNVINEVVGAGIYPPAQQPFPEASPFFSPNFPVTARDVEKAKALLAEAGVELPVRFELMFGNNTINSQINELIQAMVAEAGFEASLRPTEFAASRQEADAGNFNADQVGWSGRVDPDGNIHQFVTCQGNLNDAGYCNEQVDSLLNQARATNDPESRRALYEQAQAILQDELPIIYLYYQPWPFVTSTRVEGFKPYPDGMIRLRGVKFAG